MSKDHEKRPKIIVQNPIPLFLHGSQSNRQVKASCEVRHWYLKPI
jgi:hypothetical protein